MAWDDPFKIPIGDCRCITFHRSVKGCSDVSYQDERTGERRKKRRMYTLSVPRLDKSCWWIHDCGLIFPKTNDFDREYYHVMPLVLRMEWGVNNGVYILVQWEGGWIEGQLGWGSWKLDGRMQHLCFWSRRRSWEAKRCLGRVVERWVVGYIPVLDLWVP